MINEIQELFEKQGGEFISSPSFILEKLQKVKAYIFDWDGVFNTGTKTDTVGSGYSEVDSMGLNLLRFGFWLSNKQHLPYVAIITGENNHTAIKLAERESLHHIYFNFKNKALAFEHFTQTFNLKAEEVAFFFDDVLDFPISRLCGLRFMISRQGSPLFVNYVKENHYCDYISGQSGGHFAVREITELILGLLQQYKVAVKERTDFGPLYTDYLAQRGILSLKKFKFENAQVLPIS
jgi:3-deoxy-D-manno-octulosonate 8-phosphate phosphatase (KDO 8-P phosphatase)